MLINNIFFYEQFDITNHLPTELNQTYLLVIG